MVTASVVTPTDETAVLSGTIPAHLPVIAGKISPQSKTSSLELQAIAVEHVHVESPMLENSL